MKAWKKIASKEQKVGFKTVTIKEFEMPNGTVEEFTTWYKQGEQCIAVIALTKDNKVVVARQYRAGPEAILDELPGGGADEGEDLAYAARRELREETGYETTEPFIKVGVANKDAYTNHTHNYFLARNCEPSAKQELDETEYVETVLITIEELFNNALTAKMSDGMAVLLAYKELKEIQDAKKSN